MGPCRMSWVCQSMSCFASCSVGINRVRHDQWWREDALQLRQQPELEVDWWTANSWVFCGFLTISQVISCGFSRLFSCQNIRRNALGFAILKGEDVTAMPFSELMNEHHGMSLGNSSDQHMFFFPNMLWEKNRHGAFGAFQTFSTPCRTFIQVLGHIGSLEVRHPRLHGSGRTLLACGSSRGPDLWLWHCRCQMMGWEDLERQWKTRKKSIRLSTYLLSRMCWEYLVHKSWRNWCLGVAISRAQTSGRAAVSWMMLDS